MLTMKSAAAMLATNPSSPTAAGDRKLAVAEDRDIRVKLLATETLVAFGAKELAELRATGDEFSRSAQEVLVSVSAGRVAEALRLREEVLRPAFDRYLAAMTKAADWLEASSLRENRVMSDTTGNMSTVVLVLASWPIILLLGILLLTAVFVLVLMILFRGREMSDMP